MVLIGDSLIKHIDVVKLSKKQVDKIRASTILDVEQQIKICSMEHVNKLILHVGSNDIDNSKQSGDVIEDIVNLAHLSKSRMNTSSTVIVSGILPRGNSELNKKIKEVYLNVKSRIDDQDGMIFVDHNKLYGTKKYYHSDNIHLNDIGTKVLAANIISAIKNKPRIRNNNLRERPRSQLRRKKCVR
ncbi:uncharacterized protein LOC102802281 [Saccoglossus kowalevskii]|uniref:Uncharacterized protein LOC102802281 n=1 Tax=Saccoglossus kowalevskii TaxID=10224 RepID=A0ABM0MI98_SACKO|nr:PREDICTED: uncharacterized protein LOC102802281 [Saccoglossus kowalevskii]